MALAKRGLAVLAIVAATLLGARAWQSHLAPPLRPWHTRVPPEPGAARIDALDWEGYLKAEASAFDFVRAEVTEALDEEDRVPVNRYFAGSPVHPGRLARDWNRSFVLEPEGRPAGAAVFLHGMTDSPYSMRHLASRYAARGWVSVVVRLPGHGTVPGALAEVGWEDWQAAARLAAREALRRAGPAKPLHVVGYSMGGALAVKHALDALEDASLPRPDRLVLVSPMIGITGFARFAGLAGLPAVLPPFARAAWLGVTPEFNPFKYNSFPVNGARQAHALTVAIRRQADRLAREGRLAGLPPVLTFQSEVDFTVSTRAILAGLYGRLPANGSELVLFDLNRAARLSPLLRASHAAPAGSDLPPPPRPYRTTIVTNASPASLDVVARTTEAGAVDEGVVPLAEPYPRDVHSLSHVALPFPETDALYGSRPDPSEDFGVALGALAARGERGALVVSLDALLRTSANPFFDFLIERVDAGIDGP